MSDTSPSRDEQDLGHFGYAQELFRSMGGFSNCAISLSIISILTGAVTLYGYGLKMGGRLEMSLGWPIATVFTLLLAASMAELCSAYPTSGAMYHWAAAPGGRALAAEEPLEIRVDGVPVSVTMRTLAEVLCGLPETLRADQPVFERTGGLHAAALFDAQGNLIALREDIGRHNAVDKLIGWALLEDRLPRRSPILLVSGRGGFEIVQKALAAGVPVVASVSAPSTLAVRLARELGLTLVGFLRGRRIVVYPGDFRCPPGAD